MPAAMIADSQTAPTPADVYRIARAALARMPASLVDHLILRVLVHEAGHHFGLSDADIHALKDTVA